MSACRPFPSWRRDTWSPGRTASCPLSFPAAPLPEWSAAGATEQDMPPGKACLKLALHACQKESCTELTGRWLKAPWEWPSVGASQVSRPASAQAMELVQAGLGLGLGLFSCGYIWQLHPACFNSLCVGGTWRPRQQLGPYLLLHLSGRAC